MRFHGSHGRKEAALLAPALMSWGNEGKSISGKMKENSRMQSRTPFTIVIVTSSSMTSSAHQLSTNKTKSARKSLEVSNTHIFGWQTTPSPSLLVQPRPRPQFILHTVANTYRASFHQALADRQTHAPTSTYSHAIKTCQEIIETFPCSIPGCTRKSMGDRIYRVDLCEEALRAQNRRWGICRSVQAQTVLIDTHSYCLGCTKGRLEYRRAEMKPRPGGYR